MKANPEEISRQIEQAAARGWREMCQNAPPEVVESTGLAVHSFGSAYAVTMSRERQYPINGANAVGLFEPATESLLDDLKAFFEPRNCGFGVGVSPATRPADLAELLLQNGFTKGGRTPTLYRSTDNPPDVVEGYRIERVGPDRANVWKEVFQQIFVPYLALWQSLLIGQPDRYHYLLFDGEEPAAASQMSVEEGIGFFHFSGVLPKYRGRGLQRVLLAQRIHDAAQAGCAWVSSTADEGTPEHPDYSMRNLVRSGFDLLHHVQGYDYTVAPPVQAV